jgi:hypothetical protein
MLLKGVFYILHSFLLGLYATHHWGVNVFYFAGRPLLAKYLKFGLTFATILSLALGIVTATTAGLALISLYAVIGFFALPVVAVTPLVFAFVCLLNYVGLFPSFIFDIFAGGIVGGYQSMTKITLFLATIFGSAAPIEFLVVGFKAFRPNFYSEEELDGFLRIKPNFSARCSVFLFVTVHEIVARVVFAFVQHHLPGRRAHEDGDFDSFRYIL